MLFRFIIALILLLTMACPGLAETPPSEDFIEIPGLGRVPLPPGGRAFPSERQGLDEGGAPPMAAKPKPAPKPAEQSPAQTLNDLFVRLQRESDEAEARFLALKVLGLLAANPSDTIKLLADRAQAAQAAGATAIALALLDDVVVLDPRWTEGFVRRAKVKALSGDAAGARHDLEQAISLEPRRFDALATLGALCEEAGDKKAALDAYRRALTLSPAESLLKKSEERLRLEVEGRDI